MLRSIHDSVYSANSFLPAHHYFMRPYFSDPIIVDQLVMSGRTLLSGPTAGGEGRVEAPAEGRKPPTRSGFGTSMVIQTIPERVKPVDTIPAYNISDKTYEKLTRKMKKILPRQIRPIKCWFPD